MDHAPRHDSPSVYHQPAARPSTRPAVETGVVAPPAR